jgi:hypothetical protein
MRSLIERRSIGVWRPKPVGFGSDFVEEVGE